MMPSLGSFNVTVTHRTHRNILLCYWFIIKGTQEEPDGKDVENKV